MIRFHALAASLVFLVSAPISAQTLPPPPGAYQTAGATGDPHAVAALRAEVATLRRETEEARRLFSETKDLLGQLSQRQQTIYVQIANLSQSQVDKDTILKQSQKDLSALNAQIVEARSDLGALERRLNMANNAPATPIPASQMVAAVEPTTIVVGSPAIAPAMAQQCGELRTGSPQTWSRVIPQILPEYSFEEIDRPNGRLWARKGGSSQGFVYADVMKKIGCEA